MKCNNENLAIGELNSGQGDGQGGDDGTVAGGIVVELEKRGGDELVVARNGEQCFVLGSEKRVGKEWERREGMGGGGCKKRRGSDNGEMVREKEGKNISVYQYKI